MVDFFFFFLSTFFARFLSEKKGCSRVLDERTRSQTNAREKRERERENNNRTCVCDTRVYNYNFFKCTLTEKSTRTIT